MLFTQYNFTFQTCSISGFRAVAVPICEPHHVGHYVHNVSTKCLHHCTTVTFHF